jgi:hypothetical protein
MTRFLRGRLLRTAVVLLTATALAAGFGTQAALASTSQMCGNGGTGYCLNDWGGAGQPGDAIKMYAGGTTNDDFYVQAVNRCNGSYIATTSCPFSSSANNNFAAGGDIVQIVDTNNESECVASTTSFHAVLGSCANPISGAGGANGVIMVTHFAECSGGLGDVGFIDRYASDAQGLSWLASGGNPGVQAYYSLGLVTCWGGYQLFAP